MSKRPRYISESTSDDDPADMEYTPNNQQHKLGRKPTRTPKCFSKNALMARENRLKKKVYITNLENQVSCMREENKKLSIVVENQSFMIKNLEKQVKYLKSVISNSQDIGKLIRAINSNTGMTITTSLDKQLMINTEMANRSPRAQQVLSQTNDWVLDAQENNMYTGDTTVRHPWEENTYNSFPTPESSKSYYSNPELDELNNEELLLGLDIPLEINNDELLDIINEKSLEPPIVLVDDHNYHSPIKFEEDNANEDVGVCLHVSKNKVSLEFCPTCSDNALHSPSLT